MGAAYVHFLLFGGEQIDQQGRQTVLAERLGDKPITRAVSAAAAAVGEKDDTLAGRRNVEIAFDDDRAGVDADQKLRGVFRGGACHDRTSQLIPGSAATAEAAQIEASCYTE